MAVTEGIGTSGQGFGLAVLGDNLVYMIWLPILLGSKNFSKFFNRIMRVDEKRIQMLETAQAETENLQESVKMRHFLYLLVLGFICTWAGEIISGKLPEIKPVLTASTFPRLAECLTTFPRIRGNLLRLSSIAAHATS